MFDRILIALDGSAHALRAAEVGCGLAAGSAAEVHLLTVTRPIRVTPRLRQYLEAENLMGEPKYVLDEMTRNILSEARKIATEAGVSKVRTEVREGKPARSIVDYADNNDIDMIVLGGRGVGDVEGALLGSVSHKVSSLCTCTCVIVK